MVTMWLTTLLACPPAEEVVETTQDAATPTATAAPEGKAPDVVVNQDEQPTPPPTQASLKESEDALKIHGTMQIPDYSKGRIQIDVMKSGSIGEGSTPIMAVPFEQPGPYEMWLPADVEKVDLVAILDFESDGPDYKDVILPHPDNPITLGETTEVNWRLSTDPTQAEPPTEIDQEALDAEAAKQGENLDGPPENEGEPVPEAIKEGATLDGEEGDGGENADGEDGVGQETPADGEAADQEEAPVQD